MLSILIPTHDYTCYKLVEDLHEEAEDLGIPYEIIVAEDGSRSQVNIIANHKITALSNCQHIICKENRGQATMRNELAAMARYDWIIFIDSDAKVIRGNHFLATYINNIGKAQVIVGRLQTPAVNYDPNRTLRFRYETDADTRRFAEIRQRDPYAVLTCFNIMMHRETFLQILFDPECHEYGYEDALFGVELEKRGISILHIDNPLIHDGIDTNEDFLRKTETALRTLHGLNGRMCGRSHVENTMNRINHLHLAWAMRLFHFIFSGLIRRNLMSRTPSLTLFSIYKLGYYSTLR